MIKSKYVADFETTGEEQYKKDGKTRVWAVAVTDIGTEKTILIENDIIPFMNWLSKDNHNHTNKEVFFHNLKFDGSFIVEFLLRSGFKHSTERKLYAKEFTTLITDTGTWYEIKICFHRFKTRALEVKIHDSYKNLPFTVEKIAKAFDVGTVKGSCKHDLYRPEGYQLTEEDKEYVITDTLIVARALKVQMKKGLTKMTIGSNAMHFYKSFFESREEYNYFFPVLDNVIDSDLRHAYRGGMTYLAPRYEGKTLHTVHSFDANSMYPAQMRKEPMPYGVPVYYEGHYKHDETYPLYMEVIEIDCTLKKDHIPTIQPRNAFRWATTEFLTDTEGDPIELVVTSVDYDLIIEHYDIHFIRHLEGFKFMATLGLFNGYIDYWYNIKKTNKGPLRELAKLMLNNLYGKFGTNPKKIRKIPKLSKGEVKYINLDPVFENSVYIPIACFITAYGRKQLITTGQRFYKHLVYVDTDSLKLEGIELQDIIDNLDTDDVRLGAWKYEGTFKDFKALRPKTYITVDEEGELEVKCAGLPKEARKEISFENFEYGFTTHTKLQVQRVVGGTVLKKTDFEIKRT